jgi:hypothetical protein
MRTDLQEVCETAPEGQLCRDYREWQDLHAVRNQQASRQLDWMIDCTPPDKRGSMTVEQARDPAHLAACDATQAEVEALEERIDRDRLHELELSILAAIG